MGRKNKRKHEKIRPIRADRYIGRSSKGTKNHTAQKSQTAPKAQVASKTISKQQPEQQARQNYRPRPRRGDIWFARLGNHYGTSVQSGTRPVLVISNDTANRFSYTFTVLPMTSKMKHPEMPTHIRLGETDCVQCGETALLESMVLAEQITPIDRSALLEKIAYINDKEKMAEIEQAVGTQLGIRVCTEAV